MAGTVHTKQGSIKILGNAMTFKFTTNRTGRPRTPTADIERRRARYLELREWLPISDAELARRLGQHRNHVGMYRSQKRVPTDATLDVMDQVRQHYADPGKFNDYA
jgi:hypothetical protein